MACHIELLVFIDEKNDLILHETLIADCTNYSQSCFDNVAHTQQFLDRALFPSHALIVRPNVWENKTIIFKAIQSVSDFHNAFAMSQHASEDGKVWIETDMRAHVNPTRMEVIGKLSDKLAMRLSSKCPLCAAPGWGYISRKAGLECQECGLPTDRTLHEIYGCIKCAYQEIVRPEDSLKHAPASQCQFCNP